MEATAKVIDSDRRQTINKKLHGTESLCQQFYQIAWPVLTRRINRFEGVPPELDRIISRRFVSAAEPERLGSADPAVSEIGAVHQEITIVASSQNACQEI